MVPDRYEKGLRMLTQPAPLSGQCDMDDTVGPGSRLSSLFAAVGKAFAAAFSRPASAAAELEQLSGSLSPRAKRLLRNGD